MSKENKEMIVAKAPLRVSLLGGGTDFPAYYQERGGAVISTTIDKYVYVTVNQKFDGRVSVRYSKTENAVDMDDVKHGIIREAALLCGIDFGVEVVTISDVPLRGSGLGGSSALTVGCINAFHALNDIEYLSPYELAHKACEVEIEKLKSPIGKQDQFAAAFGGFNFIEFRMDDLVDVKPLHNDVAFEIERHCLLFYLGTHGSNRDILKQQNRDTKKNMSHLNMMQDLARRAYEMSCCPRHFNIEHFSGMMRESWEEKKKLNSGIANKRILKYCREAERAGAWAWKVNGAGGRGFLTVIAPPENHDAIIRDMGLRHVPIHFTHEGSKIVFSN